MSVSIKHILFGSLLCILVSVNFMVGVKGVVFTEEDPTIILFDEGHGQIFNRTLYGQAITDLEDLGMKVVFNKQEFNASTFEGIDVLIITDPQESISFRERNHMRDYVLQKKSMLLLANPLVETNESLDGHGDYLNYVLNDQDFGILARFWTKFDAVEPRKPTDVVKNDFLNAGKPEYLVIDVNNTDHGIFTDYDNISTIITSSCSIEDAREDGKLIVGSTEAYALPPVGDPHSFSTNIGLFVVAGRSETLDLRVAMGGSSIMFSDIEDPALGEATSWYEAADNAKLWKNTIKWLSTEIQEEIEPDTPTDLYTPFLLGITALSVVFLVGGMFLFMVGSGKQVSVSKVKDLGKEKAPKRKDSDKPEVETGKDTSKLSKRDRRLQQIKKHPKSNRRK